MGQVDFPPYAAENFIQKNLRVAVSGKFFVSLWSDTLKCADVGTFGRTPILWQDESVPAGIDLQIQDKKLVWSSVAYIAARGSMLVRPYQVDGHVSLNN